MNRMFRVAVTAVVLAVAAGISAHAQEPSLQQVYEAVQAGRLNEAHTMMDQVLRDHPKSGKAHYVQAEVLARQGRLGEAGTELARAEQLVPGLTFAKPESVRALRASIAGAATSGVAPVRVPNGGGQPAQISPAGSGVPWVGLLAAAALGIGVLLFVRSRRNAAVGGAGTALAPFGAAQPQPQPQPQPPYGPYGAAPVAPQAGAGLGSRIAGGLATGAAVGVGMVAAEALANQMFDRHGRSQEAASGASGNVATPVPDADSGGADFGVSDPGSWDDGGSSDGGGGGDWG